MGRLDLRGVHQRATAAGAAAGGPGRRLRSTCCEGTTHRRAAGRQETGRRIGHGGEPTGFCVCVCACACACVCVCVCVDEEAEEDEEDKEAKEDEEG